jgi:hypothetical protein
MRLSLDGCRHISDPGIKAISVHCPLMKKISLASCPKLSRNILVSLGASCHNLEMLKVDISKKIDVESLHTFWDCKPEVAVFVQAAAHIRFKRPKNEK